MDRKVRMLARAGFLVVAFLLCASAQDRYLVRAPSSQIGNIAARHHLTLIRSLEGSARNLHLVATPAGEDAQRTIQGLHAPAPLSDRALVKYYGASVWNAYVNQPAAFVIKVALAHVFATGSATV